MADAKISALTEAALVDVVGTDVVPVVVNMASGTKATRRFTLANLASRVSALLGLGTAAALNVPASGDASSSQVVKGDDTRLGGPGPAGPAGADAPAFRYEYTAGSPGATDGKLAIGGGTVTLSQQDANGTDWSAALAALQPGSVLVGFNATSAAGFLFGVVVGTSGGGGSPVTLTLSGLSAGVFSPGDDVRVQVGPAGAAGATGAAGTNGADGADGQGVPTGGGAGQVLTKIDGTNFNTQWDTLTANTIPYAPQTIGNWAGSAPSLVKEALDRIAALLASLNGGTGP